MECFHFSTRPGIALAVFGTAIAWKRAIRAGGSLLTGQHVSDDSSVMIGTYAIVQTRPAWAAAAGLLKLWLAGCIVDHHAAVVIVA